MLALGTEHFLTGEELSQKELLELLDLAVELKRNRKNPILAGKSFALMFEKPSLRTRLSFTVALQDLGASVVEITSAQKKTETPADSIRVLQGYVDGLMLRTFSHDTLEEMREHSRIPIINGLSDTHHPCQVLADLQTLLENFGKLAGLKLAYIGDGNNMLHSLLLLAPKVGVEVHYCCPEGYKPSAEILQRVENSDLVHEHATPEAAVQDVQAIYTDVWTSMGFESENEARLKAFAGYQVNAQLYAHAREGAIVMHCMPVHEGQEITREMIEHPQSRLFQQSENRLHAQKALLIGLFEGRRLRKQISPGFANTVRSTNADHRPI